MRRINRLITGVMLLLLSLHSPAVAETITIAADEWPPFNATPNKAPEGYFIDVTREIFGAAGIDVVYKIVPWKRAKSATLNGEFNAAIGASKKSAPNLVFPDEELVCNTLSFWVKKGNPWRFTSASSLESLALGVIDGYDYRATVNEYVQRHKNDIYRIQTVHGDNPLEMNIQKLLAGRIGALVDNEPVVRFVAQEMGVSELIEVAGYGTESECGYLAFSPVIPRSQEHARIFSEGMRRLRENGRLTQLLSRYGVKDWK